MPHWSKINFPVAATSLTAAAMSWLVLQQVKMPYMEAFQSWVLLPSASGSVLLLSLAVVWLLGFMVPCVVQVSMVFAAYVTAVPLDELTAVERRNTVNRALLMRMPPFILGYVVLFAAMGALLGGLGDLLVSQPWYFIGLRLVSGVLLVTLGLYVLGLAKLSFLPERCRTPFGFFIVVSGRKASALGPFSRGLTFGAYCLGSCAPYLLPMITLAGASTSVLSGAALLGLFALGVTVPFLLITTSSQWATRYRGSVERHHKTVVSVAGPMLIFFGLMFIVQWV